MMICPLNTLKTNVSISIKKVFFMKKTRRAPEKKSDLG